MFLITLSVSIPVAKDSPQFLHDTPDDDDDDDDDNDDDDDGTRLFCLIVGIISNDTPYINILISTDSITMK